MKHTITVKKSILFCFLLFFVSGLFAQDKAFEIGVHYSPLISTNLGDDSKYYAVPGKIIMLLIVYEAK